MQERHRAMAETFRSFVEQVDHELPGPDATERSLGAVAERLRQLSAAVRLDASDYRPARPGEELLYELARAPGDGPALYLVSDGAGVFSAPHEHLTWAVIFGISGAEQNFLYRVVDARLRLVRRAGEALVAGGDVLVSGTSSIHSTRVVGTTPTYHLHLYGKPLDALPEFAVREYSAGEAA